MDYFPRKSLSKYLITDTIDFNKHVHDIDIFINDKWRKYAGGDIMRLFKITRRKWSQPSQGDFFARIALQRHVSPDRQRIALWVISLVLATQHTYIQSMLNLARFISFLLNKSLYKYTNAEIILGSAMWQFPHKILIWPVN
jgi:hypothetical protein